MWNLEIGTVLFSKKIRLFKRALNKIVGVFLNGNWDGSLFQKNLKNFQKTIAKYKKV